MYSIKYIILKFIWRRKTTKYPSNTTRELINRAIQQTVEAEGNCMKQCSADDTKPNQQTFLRVTPPNL